MNSSKYHNKIVNKENKFKDKVISFDINIPRFAFVPEKIKDITCYIYIITEIGILGVIGLIRWNKGI